MVDKTNRQTQKLRSPLLWYGGKGKMIPKLIKLIPQHSVYVEPFGGGASLLFAKEPVSLEVYNDIDSGLVNFFRVLRNPEKFKKFYSLVYHTPYSREEFYYCSSTWQYCNDDIEMAYRWFVSVMQSFNGKGKQWSYSKKIGKCVSGWNSVIKILPAINERLKSVQVEHDDFRKIFQRYDSKETFFEVDPPYVHNTRKSKNVYKYEMSDDDHRDLVNILLNVKGKVMLNGYKNTIYNKLENDGWQRIDFDVACNTIKKDKILGIGMENNRRIESIWINYQLKDKNYFEVKPYKSLTEFGLSIQ